MGFDPATIAVIGIGASLASAGVGALGAASSAHAQAANATYQSQVAHNNQLLANYQAQQTAASAAANEEKAGLRNRASVAQLMAAEAANNIDVNTGSAKDVRTSQAQLNDLDTLASRHNAAQQIYGYQVAAGADQSQAALLQSQAAQAGTAGGIGAAGSLLSGAANAGGQYASWMRVAGNTGASGGGGYQDTTSTFDNPAPNAVFY